MTYPVFLFSGKLKKQNKKKLKNLSSSELDRISLESGNPEVRAPSIVKYITVLVLISNIADTKTEHFTRQRKFWWLLCKPINLMF